MKEYIKRHGACEPIEWLAAVACIDAVEPTRSYVPVQTTDYEVHGASMGLCDHHEGP